MKKNPYIFNPVAKHFIGEYEQQLFENERVDDLLGKISDNALNIFKTLTFDIAPKRDRNPDVVRVKLSHISDSKTVKQLVAKLLDYADDNDVYNSEFAEVKRLYLESLKKYCEALERAVELSKDKEGLVLKRFQMASMKLQNSIDFIAKEAEKEEEMKAKKLKESFYTGEYEVLNENLFQGYRGRIKQLKKILTNLITSAEGKDQRSGYGRNWKQIFLDLEQKRLAIDISDEGLARSKDKDNLDKLEKDVEKFQDEFNNALITAANKSLQQIQDDDEVGDRFQDVSDLADQALVYQTKAKTQYLLSITKLKDEKIESEEELAKQIFPLKRGDNDMDSKLKGSGLIKSIQTALENGIPSVGKLLKGKKKGNFGPITQAAIMTIQKLSGNKNANGQIDKNLLYDIMISDWVSDKDKKGIRESIDKIRQSLNESLSKRNLLGFYEIYPSLDEGKIVLNQNDFSKEFDNQVKNIVKTPSTYDESKSEVKASSKSIDVLASKLRKMYSLKVESDNFKKVDGSLKSAYSPEFIKAWNLALDEAKEKGMDNFSYFFFDGGVYNINVATSSLKNPCNISEWSEKRSIKTFSPEDSVDFLSNYLKGWKTFGMLRPDFRLSGIKSLYSSFSNDPEVFGVRDSNKDLTGAYDLMRTSIKNGSSPFIDFADLKSSVSRALKIATQINQKSSDLDFSDVLSFYNFIMMISSTISINDEGKVISSLRWIHDNVFNENKTSKIFSEISELGGDDFGRWLGSSKSGSREMSLCFEGSSLVLKGLKSGGIKVSFDLERIPDSISEFKSLISKLQRSRKKESDRSIDFISSNLYRVFADVYPSISSHVKRMNSREFSDVPQTSPFMCLDVS